MILERINMKIYIAEGIDGSGKSTIAKVLKSLCPDKKVLELREPCGIFRNFLASAAGAKDRDDKNSMSCLDEWMCFWLNRFNLWMSEILPYASDDVVVIIDRSFVSTYAYQISGRELGSEYEKSFFFWRDRLLGLFKDTDISIQHIYMRASVKVAQSRISFRKPNPDDLVQFEEEKMQQRVKSGFDIYYNDKKSNLKPFESLIVINADGTKEEVEAELRQKLLT